MRIHLTPNKSYVRFIIIINIIVIIIIIIIIIISVRSTHSDHSAQAARNLPAPLNGTVLPYMPLLHGQCQLYFLYILPYLAHNQKGAIILEMDRVVLQVH